MPNSITVLAFLLAFASLVAVNTSPSISVSAARSVVQRGSTVPRHLNDDASYYTVRQDMRRCVSPLCGGFFVRQVNHPSTRCFDGKISPECYLAEIEWNGQAALEPNKVLLRGKISSRTYPRFGKLGVLRVQEVWQAASPEVPSGIFYLVHDLGIRCITHPCLTHAEVELNSILNSRIAGVDLGKVHATGGQVDEATRAMTTKEGVIVAGAHANVSGPAGKAKMLTASQFYLRVDKLGAEKPCIRTGCSKQICAEEEVITTCEYRMEYECYKKASCERQADGNCGFTKTPELTACINRFRRKSGD
jgi:hypothetical protein